MSSNSFPPYDWVTDEYRERIRVGIRIAERDPGFEDKIALANAIGFASRPLRDAGDALDEGVS
jgi:hypothetical protein